MGDLRQRETDPPGGNDFTQARRALAQLVPFGPVTTPTLSIAQLETVLPAENGRAWSLIRELADTGRVGELERLSALMRAAVSFLRIHNIGEKRAWEMYAGGVLLLGVALMRQCGRGCAHV